MIEQMMDEFRRFYGGQKWFKVLKANGLENEALQDIAIAALDGEDDVYAVIATWKRYGTSID